MIVDASDIEKLDSRVRAALINSLPSVKPALLLGTQSAKGQTNLCVINSCFHVGANPALLGFILRPNPHGVERHSLDNILTSQRMTLNAITDAMVSRAHHTSARFPRNVSEFNACGFTASFLKDFNAPFVSESPLKIGLKLAEHQLLAINGTHLIIGAVDHVEFMDTAWREDGSLDLATMGIVGCVGLDSYHSIGDGQRFAYAKADRSPETL